MMKEQGSRVQVAQEKTESRPGRPINTSDVKRNGIFKNVDKFTNMEYTP
jgi:hypothetical protein